MISPCPALFLLSLLSCTHLSAREIAVADAAACETAAKSAQPGDTLVLASGDWRDAKLAIKAAGTAAAPVTIKAAAPGKTVFSGATQLRFGGEYLVVDGLYFRDPDPAAGDVIEFRRDSKSAAHHCRLTNCAVEVVNGRVDKTVRESHWVNLYGSDNRVDHCRIQGKTNPGSTLVVWLGPGHEGRHQIDHNDFGPRERLGENGGETIRVGTSTYSMQTAACVVEKNRFYHCDGELECISNKSCGNIYRDNTFLATTGTLTLRHGNGCLVERNVFIGDDPGAPAANKKKGNGAGGIRIIGEDHIVRNNCLDGLTGDGVRSGITLMSGIPDSSLSGYFQVKRARIEGNTLVHCAHPIMIGFGEKAGATLPPLDTLFVGNTVISIGNVVEARGSIEGVRWQKNVFFGKQLGIPPADGIEWRQTQATPPQPIDRKQVGTTW